MFTIHRLTAADHHHLRSLNALFGQAFEDEEHYGKAPPSDAYLKDFLGKDTVFVLIAREEDRIIGGLVAYELMKFERETREIYLYDIAVDAGHRRKKVATALINHLRLLGREREASILYVQADVEDAPAIALYDSLGERAEVLHFNIEVEGSEPD